MNVYSRVVFLLLLLTWMAPGCSPVGDAASSEKGPAATTPGSAEPSPQSSGGEGDAIPIASPAAAPPQPLDPPPTAEQIARWTPPPFEPLQLLAICEWKKTSFTSHLAAAPDGSHFLVAGSRALLWALTGEEPEHVFLDFTAEDNDRELRALAVAPDGKWFAVGDSEGTLRIWSLADRRELASKQLYQTGVQDVAVSPDSSEVATITYNGKVAVWSAEKLEQKNLFDVATSGVDRIEYVGPNLLAAAGESTAIWNTVSGEKERDLPAGRYNDTLARTPDGAKLVFGGEDELRIWNVAAAKLDDAIISGVSGDSLASISADGKMLATSNGRQIDLWNLADGRRLQSIPGYGWAIVGVSWLPSNLLAVASESGVTRIWGVPAVGEPLGLKPLHTPVAMPDPAAKTPATPEQLRQLVDWSAFPALPGSKTGVYSQTELTSVAPVGIPEARTFYRYFLNKAGWVESPPNPANPASIEFRKAGSAISGYFSDAGEGKTNISLHHAGVFDVRWAPKADAEKIEIVYENAGSSSYRAHARILQLETSLLRKLHAAGWAAYARLNTSYGEEPDKRDMEFVRNGATLRASIGKFPDDTAETYTVQYTLFSNDAWAPVPPDAGYVEFDGSTEPELIAVTELSLAAAAAFYDRELTAHGWLVRPIGRAVRDKQAWLPYLREQCNMTVGLTRLPDGRTLVRIGNASGSMWAASQPAEESAAEAGDSTDEGEQPPARGLQAADFPLLNAAKTGSFDPLGKTIEVRIEGSTLADAAKLYTDALGELGWKASDRGIRDEEYTFFDFTKDDQEISLRARRQDGVAVVNFAGDGLLWTKELPGGKQLVSYETWLRLNKLPASLEYLDRYEAEMKSIAAK